MTSTIRLALSLFTLTSLSSLALADQGGADPGCADKRGGFHDKMIERFDTNHDGQLSAEERAQMRVSHDQKRAERIARFDVNKDGVLDETERSAMRAERAQRMFGRLDANQDGQLTPDEVKCSPLARRFEQIDTDKSGTISPAELAVAPMGHHGGFGRRGHRGNRGNRG